MNFEGRSMLGAPPAAVWDVLLDVDQFAACMPGVEEVQQVDSHTFDGTIGAAVGPMSGKFSFRAQILESDPPRQMTARVNGEDSVTRSVMRADIGFVLTPVEPGATELSYQAAVDIRGRLAILGDMVFRAAAAVMLEEFTRRLQQRVAEAARRTDPAS